MSIFETLNSVNVNGHTEKKANLTYLSWAWAWAEVKKAFPMSYYTIYENENGWFYHTDGHTGWVKTGVTVVDGDYQLEHIEYLPIMDFKNKSISLENITSTDVNKTIQRSLTKAVARHGLGLYIYAGEDLPEEEQAEIDEKKAQKKVDKYLNKGNIDAKTKDKILSELKRTGQDEKTFLNFYKITKWEELDVMRAEKLIEQLATKPNKE